MNAKRWIGVATLVLATWACADTAGTAPTLPEAAPPAAAARKTDIHGLAFGTHEPIRLLPEAPALAAAHAEAWAVQGKRTEIRLYHVAPGPHQDPELFASLTIPPNALLRPPGGVPLARGDSVLVSVDAEPGKIGVTLAPHGLQFAGKVGAELRFSHKHGDTRGRPTDQLRVWYFAGADTAPELVESYSDTHRRTVNATLRHFSNYAIAY